MLRPAPFQLTSAARASIREAVREFRELNGHDAIPALVWVSAELNPSLGPDHLAIGLYDVRAHIEDALYDSGGLEIGIAMLPDDFAQVVGRTIDANPSTGGLRLV